MENVMEKFYDILIQGGVVVTGAGIRKADVGIQGEQILSVEVDIPAPRLNLLTVS
jgi:urease alpha subunit